MSSSYVGLLKFAQLAGRNMLEVIPDETLRQKYVRGPLNIHYFCDPDIITELLVGKGRYFPTAKPRGVRLPNLKNTAQMLWE